MLWYLLFPAIVNSRRKSIQCTYCFSGNMQVNDVHASRKEKLYKFRQIYENIVINF